MRVVLVLTLCLALLFAVTWAQNANCNHNSCDACTDESGCVWCESDLECVPGGFLGPHTALPSCSNWKHKQCYINGRWYTWYPIFVLVIILIIACCCGIITFFCCNPCLYLKKQYQKRGDYIRWEQMQTELQETRAPTEEQLRRESLRKKWNLK